MNGADRHVHSTCSTAQSINLSAAVLLKLYLDRTVQQLSVADGETGDDCRGVRERSVTKNCSPAVSIPGVIATAAKSCVIL